MNRAEFGRSWPSKTSWNSVRASALAATKSWRSLPRTAGTPTIASMICCTAGRTACLVGRRRGGGGDGLLGGATARGGCERLDGAREVEQVRALGVVEPKGSRERVEHAARRAGDAAGLEAGVVRDADAGQDGALLAAQPWDPSGAVVGQADVGGFQSASARSEELANFAACLHRHASVDASWARWVTLAGSPSQGLSIALDRCFLVVQATGAPSRRIATSTGERHAPDRQLHLRARPE